jgi:LysR family nod box-dependent transcriptional activator
MDLRNVDLNLLTVLNVLLQERSVSKAAARLDLGQPAVSAALAKLRELFDDQLLVRRGREMEPTAFANGIADEVAALLARISDVLDTSKQFEPATTRRTFSLTMTDYAAEILLPPLIVAFERDAPLADLAVRTYHSPMASNPDWQGTDVVIAPPLGVQTGHASERLFVDEWACIVSSERNDVGDALDRGAFVAGPHVAMEFEPGRQSIAMAVLEGQGIRPRIALRVPTFALAIRAVVGSRYVALMLKRLAERYASVYPIKLVRCDLKLPKLEERLFWSHRTDHDRPLVWFRGLIQQIARDL